MKLISTLICTYNAKKFFDSTIRSVLNQTYKNQEILIRDDWSTDGTIEILKQRAKKDNRIKLFIKPWIKKWPYGWLNYLLDKAKWKYIAIQDHDDNRHPEKLEKQVEFLENHNKYNACSTNRYEFWESINRICITWVWKNQHPHTSLIFKNKAYRYNTKLKYHNDEDFKENKLISIYHINDFLNIHTFRKGNSNLSLKRSRDKLNKFYNFIYPFYWIYLLFCRKYFNKSYFKKTNKKFNKFSFYLN
jgi:glycosyltransferase involved in cell wall biosynthesis